MRQRRGHSRAIAAGLLLTLVAVLAGCGTSNIDHPHTVDRPYLEALGIIQAWCPTATVVTEPAGVADGIDPDLLVVASEAYWADKPVPAVTSSSDYTLYAPMDFHEGSAVRPAAQEEPSVSSTVDTVEPCDPTVPTTVTLELKTRVPDLTGLTAVAAAELLNQRRLDLDRPDVPIPDDAVVASQDPSRDAYIVLDDLPYASERVAAEFSVRVPDLRGITEDVVCDIVGKKGLGECSLEVTGDGPAPGVVTQQDPAPGGLVDLGTAMRVSVERAVAQVQVPGVVSLTPSDACSVLAKSQLGCQPDSAPAADLGPYVVDQAPPEGAFASPDSVVQLVVGTRNIRVPDVLGRTEADACAAIEAAGLACRVADRSGSGEPGLVRAQAPPPNAVSSPRVAVAIDVPTGVEVPDVRGQSPGSACRTLVDAGLTCGGLDESAQGSVVNQVPAGGVVVEEGREIVLVAEAEPTAGIPLWPFIAGAVVLIVAVATAVGVGRGRGRFPPGPPSVQVLLRPGTARVATKEAREW